ncbi:Med11p KNAG_0E02340 [Huiozyma naganishii CBS 8797]|uniref:Mediator of RNA polymerase II transcription subunit 11 n=1 Tax=Huiozyma naganishii (strain ATCC MYA-139 / BCRC 22969 / CBS 8797 / KCTC 17520 / NBRC 10181 / NCYC 3082 / Yp74L-3) TaxID=1071383 RepID=J7R6M9_HUIN7|nr:hypothetical protein KNAG_0E02340 [Kazachstania naganishii CBS 8797]CCK70495.1 hypothetical protein KNAG_0E02340 [Kazachstania naganishii CBS 8797]
MKLSAAIEIRTSHLTNSCTVTPGKLRQRAEGMQSPYVQERLQSLETIDLQLCSMLQEVSEVVFTFSEIKRGNVDVKPQFTQHVTRFYSLLNESTGKLRDEIRLLDENVGKRLLPINNVSKRALGQDDEKLQEQMKLLQEVLEGPGEHPPPTA